MRNRCNNTTNSQRYNRQSVRCELGNGHKGKHKAVVAFGLINACFKPQTGFQREELWWD